MKQGKELYYAVSRRGRGGVFTSLPVRNEHFGLWEGKMETCYSSVISDMEADGLALPDISFSDEPVRMTITVSYEE